MKVNIKNCFIILNEPRYPENIGASARAIKNMGLGGLIVVNPYRFDMDAIKKMATHEALDTVESIEVKDTLLDAIGSFNYAVATTARTGRQRRPTHTPRSIVQLLAPLSHNNRIAIVFGSEKFGLSNNDLPLCQAIVNIPTADFSSINLAQSVMIMAYELFFAAIDIKDHTFLPSCASIYELEAMYEHLKEVFLEIGYINPENPDYFMQNFRRLLGRLQLKKKEVKMIRGFLRQLMWKITSLRQQEQSE